MKKSMAWPKRIGCILFNIFCLAVDFAVLLAIFCFLSASLCLLCAIIFSMFHIDNCYMQFIKCIFGSTYSISNLIAAFGTILSLSLIPIISFLTSTHISLKRNDMRISEALARADSFGFYVAIMPYGIWNGLRQAYYSHCIESEQPLSKYKLLLECDYCFLLTFVGEFFQSYKIDLIDMGYEMRNGKRCSVQNFDLYTSFVWDTTGNSCGPFIEGTNIASIFANGDFSALTRYLTIPRIGEGKNIVYTLHIEENDETDKHVFHQMFGKNNGIRFFPLIRLVFHQSTKHHKDLTSYRIKLNFSDLPVQLSRNRSKYQLNIFNINVQTVRRKKERKSKNQL